MLHDSQIVLKSALLILKKSLFFAFESNKCVIGKTTYEWKLSFTAAELVNIRIKIS